MFYLVNPSEFGWYTGYAWGAPTWHPALAVRGHDRLLEKEHQHPEGAEERLPGMLCARCSCRQDYCEKEPKDDPVSGREFTREDVSKGNLVWNLSREREKDPPYRYSHRCQYYEQDTIRNMMNKTYKDKTFILNPLTRERLEKNTLVQYG